jgi:hypothetical protein
MIDKDFTPTKEQISLHGLGFIQVILADNVRLHVWHPELPKRSCYEHSAVHNHRFSFHSTVLIGTQINKRYDVHSSAEGTHDLISHDGPRTKTGSRLSYVADRVILSPQNEEIYTPGQSYIMAELGYHETPNSGIVVTLMKKLSEGTTHASSIITHGETFDQSFDRFQLSNDEMWSLVVSSLKSA